MNAEQPLRQLPVDLGEIDEVASTHPDEYETPILGFLDTQTGQVHTVLRAALSQAEEGEPGEDDDDVPEDVDADEWALAIAIAEDSAGPYERIDAWESREEFQRHRSRCRSGGDLASGGLEAIEESEESYFRGIHAHGP